MPLEMVYYPDPRLNKKSAPVAKVTADLKALLPEMFEAMYRHRGIGLAGPQVGVLQRIIVANMTGDPKNKGDEQVFLNPEIVRRAGTMLEEEGCLSLPGLSAKVKRSAEVGVRWTALDGKEYEADVEGLAAKLFQHEIDHLDGILMIEKMSAADLKQSKALLREMEESFKAGKPPARRRDRVTAEL